MRPLAAERIAAAMSLVDPVFLHTPLLTGTPLDDALGARLALKVETLNPIRSFKGRGTSCFVASLADYGPLVCASAGNFGQGLARAAGARGIGVTVFAATNANPLKLDAMRRLGATVVLAGSDFDAAKGAAREFAAGQGARYVEDGAIAEIAEGAGTIALEALAQGAAPEVLLVPLGNGALATGMGCWIRAHAPATRVVGVVAEGAPSMRLSFEARRPVPTPAAATIADGIAVREPVPYAVDSLAATVDEVCAVGEDALVRAMQLVHDHAGLVVEPAGVAGLAALVAHPERWRGMRVLVPLCGGNVTPVDLRRWLLT